MTEPIDTTPLAEDASAPGSVDPAATPPDPTDKLVPVTEAIRYRRRAQTAEQQLDTTRTKLAELQEQFGEAQRLITSLERRQKIDALLAESDAIDLDAARLLTERIVSEMDEPDVRAAVEDLRRHKPYLFRRSRSRTSGASVDESLGAADHVAAAARATGDRRDLLHYLRLRRRS